MNGSARVAAVTIVARNYLALAGSFDDGRVIAPGAREMLASYARRLLYWSSSGSRA